MHTQLACLCKQRIVYVGDIANTSNGVTTIDKATLKNVVDEESCSVSEMCGVIRRDAARVHEHGVPGRKRNNFASSRVVQPHAHERYAWARGSRLIPVNFGATRVL